MTIKHSNWNNNIKESMKKLDKEKKISEIIKKNEISEKIKLSEKNQIKKWHNK